MSHFSILVCDICHTKSGFCTVVKVLSPCTVRSLPSNCLTVQKSISMKSFPSLYFTNLFLIGGTGLLTTYLALYLGQHNVSTFCIGLLTSFYYLGLLLGSKLGYHLIKSVGHIRTFVASTAAVTTCVAAHALSDNIYLWLVLRLIVGLSMMCNYMVLESWLNEQTASESRGRVFSIYMIMSSLGMVLGQLALSQFSELGYEPLFLVCMDCRWGLFLFHSPEEFTLNRSNRFK